MEERSGLILRNEGVAPVFMLQPMLILERDRTGATPIEHRLFDFNVSSYLPNYEPFILRAVQFVREREAKMAAHVGGTFIDLTGIFKGVEGQIYTDYARLTPLGNQVVSRHIADAIVPIIQQPSAQAPYVSISTAGIPVSCDGLVRYLCCVNATSPVNFLLNWCADTRPLGSKLA